MTKDTNYVNGFAIPSQTKRAAAQKKNYDNQKALERKAKHQLNISSKNSNNAYAFLTEKKGSKN